jgi:CobB/CobQ-like glutamine amidotransferase domain
MAWQLASWRDNDNSYRAAAAAHRVAAAGHDVRDVDDGYFFADSVVAGRAAAALGLDLSENSEDAERGAAVHPPRIALFAGEAAGYPYYAYYAHCLLSLGLTYRAVEGKDIAAGALDEADLFVIPGGFATWGFDRAEEAPGADSAVRSFLANGGAAIGSCGGAFYLSAGRPGWTATADVKAKYTHEYLQTGAAVVNVRLHDPRLARGCPSLLEVPYYHGPAFPDSGSNAESLADFESLAVPSRLFIDNPLSADRFEKDMAGRPAALFAQGSAGRAILFSPHPEMGDFLRKHISLDGYVRKYLPIRGHKVLDETLRFYVPEDSPSFRLVLNAAKLLDCFSKPGARRSAAPGPDREALAGALAALDPPLQSTIGDLRDAVESDESAEWRRLIEAELDRRSAEWQERRDFVKACLADRDGFVDGLLCRELTRLCRQAAASLDGLDDKPLVHRLAMAELPTRLLCAASRILSCDGALTDYEGQR